MDLVRSAGDRTDGPNRSVHHDRITSGDTQRSKAVCQFAPGMHQQDCSDKQNQRTAGDSNGFDYVFGVRAFADCQSV